VGVLFLVNVAVGLFLGAASLARGSLVVVSAAGEYAVATLAARAGACSATESAGAVGEGG
jgi:hypothetical protein